MSAVLLTMPLACAHADAPKTTITASEPTVVGASPTAAAEAVPADLDAALDRAATLGRPVLVLYRAPWCPFSMRVEENLHTDPRFEVLAGELVTLTLDTNEFVSASPMTRYEIRGTPTLQLLDVTGAEVLRVEGDDVGRDEFIALAQAAVTVRDRGAGKVEQRALLGDPNARLLIGYREYHRSRPAEALEFLRPLHAERPDWEFLADTIDKAAIEALAEESEARRDALRRRFEEHPGDPERPAHALELARWHDARGETVQRDIWIERTETSAQTLLRTDSDRIYETALAAYENLFFAPVEARRLRGEETDAEQLRALIDHTEDVLARRPTHVASDEAFIANFYRHAGEVDTTVEYYGRLQDRLPDEYFYPVYRAQLLYGADRHAEARALLEPVLAQTADLNRMRAHLVWARLLQVDGDLEGARQTAQRGLDGMVTPRPGSRIDRLATELRKLAELTAPA